MVSEGEDKEDPSSNTLSVIKMNELRSYGRGKSSAMIGGDLSSDTINSTKITGDEINAKNVLTTSVIATGEIHTGHLKTDGGTVGDNDLVGLNKFYKISSGTKGMIQNI